MTSLHNGRFSLDEWMPLIRESLEAGKTVRFSPQGVSMLPMLRPGEDEVVLSTAPSTLSKYDLPLYQRDNGQYVLHRVVEVGDGYTCIGDNQYYLEHGVRHEQVIALVTGFYRRGKRYSINSCPYRIYCFIWHYTRGLRHFCNRGINWLRRRIR